MALGMIEVMGFTTAIVVGDTVAKAGNVEIIAIDSNKPANADSVEVPLIMVVKFQGGVSDVEQALEAGVEEAKKRNLYVTSHIISRQEEDTKKMAKLNALGRDKIKK